MKNIKEFLEEKHDLYNRPDFIPSDPISIPHLFRKKEDIEIAGFFASTIAWGQRVTIIKNANRLMQQMDFTPHDFILNHTKKDLLGFKNFKHRTYNGTDCIFFIQSLKNIYKKHGGLEKVFTFLHSPPPLIKEGLRWISGKEPGFPARQSVVMQSILNFRKIFFSIPHPVRTKKHVSCPPMEWGGGGSSCKRLNMFLRWMVRKDRCGVDFGIWNNLKMSELLCPLDVHSGNVARKLGLITRKQNDWEATEELTFRLIEFDSADPVKYDFALFGLGVFEKF